jgi:hypothetical protein
MWNCFNCGEKVNDEIKKCPVCLETKENSCEAAESKNAKNKIYTVFVIIGAMLWWLIISTPTPFGIVSSKIDNLRDLLRWSDGYYVIIFTLAILGLIWRKKKLNFKIIKNNLTSEDHIAKIYNYYLQNRKDLSENGIIIKIEEEYKYKEEQIKKVLGIPKNDLT